MVTCCIMNLLLLKILFLVLMNVIIPCCIILGGLICLHKLQMKGYYPTELGPYPMMALKINSKTSELHYMGIRMEHILQSIEDTYSGEFMLLSWLMMHCVHIGFLL